MVKDDSPHSPIASYSRRFDRRHVLRLMVGGGTAAVVSGLLAACGGKSSSTKTTVPTTASASTSTSSTGGGAASPSATSAASPSGTTAAASSATTSASGATGGSIVVGTGLAFKSLDPARLFEVDSNMIAHGLYDSLVTFEGEDLKTPKPSIAAKWEVAPDGLSYNFTMQSNVKFVSGNPLTSTDVQWSLQ
jgi:ABC-type transport system substrate-binding protein